MLTQIKRAIFVVLVFGIFSVAGNSQAQNLAELSAGPALEQAQAPAEEKAQPQVQEEVQPSAPEPVSAQEKAQAQPQEPVSAPAHEQIQDQAPEQIPSSASQTAQAENENLEAPVSLNMEAVEGLVQGAQPVNPLTLDLSKYTLGAEDVIEVTVMRHPEVSGQFPINTEGKIQYNFVGDILVTGMTKEDAAQVIADRLSEYIINPEVSIRIIGYNSKVVYVVGEVGQPGKIFMRGDTITVREALVQAGLPQLSGVLKKSWVITPAEDGRAAKKTVNIYALMYEGDLRENFLMKPGDVLYIPPTLMTKTMRAITPITAPINDARSVTPY